MDNIFTTFQRLTFAIAILLTILVVLVIIRGHPRCSADKPIKRGNLRGMVGTPTNYPYNYSLETDGRKLGLRTMYHTSDIDPLITTQLDTTRKRPANVYTDNLQEYGPARDREVGVTVGPLGPEDTYDDGIPENWYLPPTPVQNEENGQDHYSTEHYSARTSPANDTCGFFVPFQPDHEPVFGPS